MCLIHASVILPSPELAQLAGRLSLESLTSGIFTLRFCRFSTLNHQPDRDRCCKLTWVKERPSITPGSESSVLIDGTTEAASRRSRKRGVFMNLEKDVMP